VTEPRASLLEWRPMLPCAALLLTLLAALVVSTPVGADDAVPAAHALLVAWHEDPRRIDRARALLETAVAADAAPETLVELSRVWFLTGDFRARSEGERVAAYEQGSEAARRAIAAMPRNERAHLWLAINSGRTAEIKGVMRALGLVNTIREESETVLKLNPSNVDGLILAAGLAAEMPGFMGGDRAKAETLFKRALEVDPHQTGGRLELARFYVNGKRWRDAQRELQRVVDEPAPTDLPRWMVSERPRARAMLGELYERGRVTGAPPQSP
jgi:tetratricopeptide (TPR) repeat protein